MPCSRIRRARAEESAELTGLAIRATKHAGYDADAIARLVPVLRINLDLIAAGLVSVAEDVKGTVIGLAAVRPLGLVGLFLLESIFVDPIVARQGIGRCLFEAASDQVRRLAGCSMLIYAIPTSTEFYVRLGAIRIGTAPCVSSPDLLMPMFAFPVSPVDDAGAQRTPRQEG
jgi:GNAT superfamily N-acetyltransferase